MKISIVTISYNSEKTIEETIKSILNQGYSDLEYIIIDGGSKDATLDIIKKYEDKIAYVISEKDEGISDAFNKGIAKATGDVIGIINSDDILMPGALKKLDEVIEDSTDVLHGNVIMFGDDRRTSINIPRPLKKFKFEMAVHHPSCFIRKSAYDKYGLYLLEYKASMDRELLMRMYYNGAKFQYCDYEFSKFKVGGNSTKEFYNCAIKEDQEISIKFGANKYLCKLYSVYKITRFAIAYFLRKIGIGEFVRVFLHAKNTKIQ